MSGATPGKMPTTVAVCFAITRLMVCAWVGGAALFVITSVAEQVHDGFDSVTKDALATIRFPHYYVFGFSLMALTLISGLWVARSGLGGRRRMPFYIALVALSMVLMILDYVLVYSPLQDLLRQETALSERTAEFDRLHSLSETANTVHVGLAFAAAILISLPRPDISASDDPANSSVDS